MPGVDSQAQLLPLMETRGQSPHVHTSLLKCATPIRVATNMYTGAPDHVDLNTIIETLKTIAIALNLKNTIL